MQVSLRVFCQIYQLSKNFRLHLKATFPPNLSNNIHYEVPDHSRDEER